MKFSEFIKRLISPMGKQVPVEGVEGWFRLESHFAKVHDYRKDWFLKTSPLEAILARLAILVLICVAIVKLEYLLIPNFKDCHFIIIIFVGFVNAQIALWLLKKAGA